MRTYLQEREFKSKSFKEWIKVKIESYTTSILIHLLIIFILGITTYVVPRFIEKAPLIVSLIDPELLSDQQGLTETEKSIILEDLSKANRGYEEGTDFEKPGAPPQKEEPKTTVVKEEKIAKEDSQYSEKDIASEFENKEFVDVKEYNDYIASVIDEYRTAIDVTKGTLPMFYVTNIYNRPDDEAFYFYNKCTSGLYAMFDDCLVAIDSIDPVKFRILTLNELKDMNRKLTKVMSFADIPQCESVFQDISDSLGKTKYKKVCFFSKEKDILYQRMKAALACKQANIEYSSKVINGIQCTFHYSKLSENTQILVVNKIWLRNGMKITVKDPELHLIKERI